MARDYKPKPRTVCVECRQPVLASEEYYWTKSRGYPPTFIHKKCYEKLLPKKGVRNNNLLYRTCSFEDYVPRADGKKISEIYGNIIR